MLIAVEAIIEKNGEVRLSDLSSSKLRPAVVLASVGRDD